MMGEGNILGFLLILHISLGVKHRSGIWKERKLNLSEIEEHPFGHTGG